MRMSPLEHGVIGFATLAVVLMLVLWIGRDTQRFRHAVGFVVVATFCLVVLGAFVRLSDAGLGCPDWPGCYGGLSPLHSYDAIAEQQQLDPTGPVSHAKAWKEMVHRYLASFVGACTLGFAIAAVRNRRRWQRSAWLAIGLFLVTCLQGAFGAWTVTLQLRPVIVTGHLIGGFLTLSLLLLLWMSTRPTRGGGSMFGSRSRPGTGLRWFAAIALIVVIVQILLGGWVSTNYAALACPDFPTCQGQLVPSLDFTDGYDLGRELGKTSSGEPLPASALATIHWMHRVFALVVALIVGLLAWRLRALEETRRLAIGLGVVLALQLVLGVSNVVFQLPLDVSVAHNGGAALLLLTLIVVNHRLTRCASSSLS
ncbi:COX15/CtaA family protein [soil metagenome]